MAETSYTIVIGDKNYSSWSLRPWLALAHSGLTFREERIWLGRSDSKAEILRSSPSGKVPALKTDDGIIWDSLAILEYLAEQHPSARLWPAYRATRAAARSVSAEMHSGFMALRNDMPMDLLSSLPSPPITEALRRDIERIVAIWMEARHRARGAGPFLFGDFSNADAMFAPVATRFRTYGVDLSAFGDDGAAAAYVDTIFAMPAMAEWARGAEAELKDRSAH